MHIFAPGKRIQLDYVAESIVLARGGSTDLLDILFTNHDPNSKPIERIHVVYPHPIPIATEDDHSTDESDIKDYTGTLADLKSPFNRFYQTRETRLTVNNEVGYDRIVVEMPNPNDITKSLEYSGLLKGRRRLTSFQVDDEKSFLTQVQWDILSKHGWSVFTIHFESPVKFEEARWLRLQGRNGIIHHNRMPALEYWPKKLCGLLTHTFEIAGPKDVKHRIVSSLKSAGKVTQDGAAPEGFREELLDLQDKLLQRGINCPGTETTIKDWRINVFTDYYRRVDEPSFWGDIKPAGGLSNLITDKDGNVDTVLQWKAGDEMVPPQNKGLFGARIRGHLIILLVPFLPWIALSFAILINSDKIWRFVCWVCQSF